MEYIVHGYNRRLDGLFPTPRLHRFGEIAPSILMLEARTHVIRSLDDCLAVGDMKKIAAKIPFGNVTLSIRHPESGKVLHHLASIVKGEDPRIIALALHKHWQSGDIIKIWRPLGHRVEIALYKNQSRKYQQ